jgi:hypothetical protein
MDKATMLIHTSTPPRPIGRREWRLEDDTRSSSATLQKSYFSTKQQLFSQRERAWVVIRLKPLSIQKLPDLRTGLATYLIL